MDCGGHMTLSATASFANDVSKDYSSGLRIFRIRKGKCVIFNHRSFHSMAKQIDRSGTDKDAAGLKRIFKRLNFVVDLHIDKTKGEVETLMESCRTSLI